MSEQRIQFFVVLGINDELISDAELFDLEKKIGITLSRKSAGCTIYRSIGFWSDDGQEFLDSYSDGKLQKNINIVVSVPLECQESFLEYLKTSLLSMSELKKYEVNQVHIEHSFTFAKHFNLQA